MSIRMAAAGLIAMTAGCVQADPLDIPLLSRTPIRSAMGFELLPPPGQHWSEQFDNNQLIFSKRTDPASVTFYAGAVATRLEAPFGDMRALLAFVRSTKDQWGDDGRFSDISTSFVPDSRPGSCVRYRMKANDRGANNRNGHAFLLVHTAGRFCTHPENPQLAVDMFYSTRHVPGYDPKDFHAEGEVFVDGLRFRTPLAQ